MTYRYKVRTFLVRDELVESDVPLSVGDLADQHLAAMPDVEGYRKGGATVDVLEEPEPPAPPVPVFERRPSPSAWRQGQEGATP